MEVWVVRCSRCTMREDWVAQHAALRLASTATRVVSICVRHVGFFGLRVLAQGLRPLPSGALRCDCLSHTFTACIALVSSKAHSEAFPFRRPTSLPPTLWCQHPQYCAAPPTSTRSVTFHVSFRADGHGATGKAVGTGFAAMRKC